MEETTANPEAPEEQPNKGLVSWLALFLIWLIVLGFFSGRASVRAAWWHAQMHEPPGLTRRAGLPEDHVLVWNVRETRAWPFLVVIDKNIRRPDGRMEARVWYVALFGWVKPIAAEVRTTPIGKEPEGGRGAAHSPTG